MARGVGVGEGAAARLMLEGATQQHSRVAVDASDEGDAGHARQDGLCDREAGADGLVADRAPEDAAGGVRCQQGDAEDEQREERGGVSASQEVAVGAGGSEEDAAREDHPEGRRCGSWAEAPPQHLKPVPQMNREPDGEQQRAEEHAEIEGGA